MQLRQSGLTWHVAGDDVVVLDLDRSVYLRLNKSGRTLWELLAEPCSVADLRRALIERYGVDAAQAAADVDAFIAQACERQLLEPTGDEP